MIFETFFYVWRTFQPGAAIFLYLLTLYFNADISYLWGWHYFSLNPLPTIFWQIPYKLQQMILGKGCYSFTGMKSVYTNISKCNADITQDLYAKSLQAPESTSNRIIARIVRLIFFFSLFSQHLIRSSSLHRNVMIC